MFGMCVAHSEKWYKRHRAKRERAKLRNALANNEYEKAETELSPWDEWSTDRDGKRWWHNPTEKDMRK